MLFRSRRGWLSGSLCFEGYCEGRIRREKVIRSRDERWGVRCDKAAPLDAGPANALAGTNRSSYGVTKQLKPSESVSRTGDSKPYRERTPTSLV